MRGQDEISLKDAIKQLFESYKLDDRLHETRLTAMWSSIVGPSIANHTQDMYLYKGVLQVKITSAVIRQELAYAKTRIIKHINKRFGKIIVEDIILR